MGNGEKPGEQGGPGWGGSCGGWRPVRAGLPAVGGAPGGGPHGRRYSMQLLSVCFRPMMMAICTNRSIMQPLRWHCRDKGMSCARAWGHWERPATRAVREEGGRAPGTG